MMIHYLGSKEKIMKRINNQWWRGADGYYQEIRKGVYEGPFEDMQKQPATGDDSTVIDSGIVVVKPVDRLK